MRGWRRHYGAGPGHLAGLLACFALAAYALSRVHAQGGTLAILEWFAGSLVLHDLVGWPLYALADRAAVRMGAGRPGRARHPVPWVNHVRAPVVVSGVLLGISFPLVFRLSQAYYAGATGFTEDAYLGHWLEVTAALFAGSGFLYAARVVAARAGARRRGSDPRR